MTRVLPAERHLGTGFYFLNECASNGDSDRALGTVIANHPIHGFVPYSSPLPAHARSQRQRP